MKGKRIYMYPHTPAQYEPGSNDYIQNLVSFLRKQGFSVNPPTTAGLLDMLKNVFQSDVIYFNWIEDLPHRRFGKPQILLLLAIIICAKFANVKILWFVHNRLSHSKEKIMSKRFIEWLMRISADIVLSHLPQRPYKVPETKFHSFDHPVPDLEPVKPSAYKFDALIWGTVSPYKGIAEFIEQVRNNSELQKYAIVVAGKFSSESYFKECSRNLPENITIVNRLLSEEELRELVSISKAVLFTYNSKSVQSSGALSKSLSYGSPIIGPNIGSFGALGSKKLIVTYDSVHDLQIILRDLHRGSMYQPSRQNLIEYASSTSWQEFSKFIANILYPASQGTYVEAGQLN